MTLHATARSFEEIHPGELPFAEHVARTARTVAVGNDADLNRALESVSWERRGLLGVLRRRPRPQRIAGT
jgi:hypothetical protein